MLFLDFCFDFIQVRRLRLDFKRNELLLEVFIILSIIIFFYKGLSSFVIFN